MQGGAGEKGPSAWENTHPHARTCFHSECALDQWDKLRADRLPGLPPLQGLSAMEGEAYPGGHASLTGATDGKTCFPGRRGAAWEGGWSSLLPRTTLCYPVAKGRCT